MLNNGKQVLLGAFKMLMCVANHQREVLCFQFYELFDHGAPFISDIPEIDSFKIILPVTITHCTVGSNVSSLVTYFPLMKEGNGRKK